MLTWSGKQEVPGFSRDAHRIWSGGGKKVVILGLPFITSTGQYQLMCIKMRDLQKAIVQRTVAFNFEFREEPSF